MCFSFTTQIFTNSLHDLVSYWLFLNIEGASPHILLWCTPIATTTKAFFHFCFQFTSTRVPEKRLMYITCQRPLAFWALYFVDMLRAALGKVMVIKSLATWILFRSTQHYHSSRPKPEGGKKKKWELQNSLHYPAFYYSRLFSVFLTSNLAW